LSAARHTLPASVRGIAPLSTSQKGAAAEAEIAAAAIRLGLTVLRPITEGRRYDLALDIGEEIIRVQCKWAPLRGGAIGTRCDTSRHTPRGYRRTTYTQREIDAVAAYSADTDRCYLIPIGEVEGRWELRLRLEPARNGQIRGVRWASDYEFERSLDRNWRTPRELRTASDRGPAGGRMDDIVGL